MAMDEDEAEASVADGELIARPNDYVVKFNFVVCSFACLSACLSGCCRTPRLITMGSRQILAWGLNFCVRYFEAHESFAFMPFRILGSCVHL